MESIHYKFTFYKGEYRCTRMLGRTLKDVWPRFHELLFGLDAKSFKIETRGITFNGWFDKHQNIIIRLTRNNNI